jgi:hypothetical protein
MKDDAILRVTVALRDRLQAALDGADVPGDSRNPEDSRADQRIRTPMVLTATYRKSSRRFDSGEFSTQSADSSAGIGTVRGQVELGRLCSWRHLAM